MLHAVGLLLALQQPSTAPQAPSPIAKAIVRPSEVAIQVGDTVRLTVSAQDSAGRPFSNTSVRWFQAGGRFEGTVDSTGLVTGGATGTLTVTALVSPTGGGSPATAFARVTILPGPAAKIALEPTVTRLYAGQSVQVTATPYSANDDRRYDEVIWSSDA